MSFWASLWVEIQRIFRSRITWLAILLTMCTPLAGYSFYQPANSITRASQVIANPVLAGTFFGAVLFALFTLFELDRVQRSGMSTLTDALVFPHTLYVTRMLAILTVATVTAFLAMALYLPYTYINLGNIFKPFLYIASFFILMLPALWMGCLFSAVFYQITRRVELSFFLFAACVFLCMSEFFYSSFLLRWINPAIPVYSDDFSNAQALRMALYNRIFWLLLLAGFWFLSALLIRRYNKGIFGSLVCNIRYFYLPLLAVILITGSAAAFVYQPFVNHSPLDVEPRMEFEYNENLFLKSAHVEAEPDVRLGIQHGTATFNIRNENLAPVEQKININCGYHIEYMAINGTPIEFTDLENDQWTEKQISLIIPPEKDIELVIEYGGYPQMWSLVETLMGDDEISRDYIYLTGGGFAPVLDILREDENQGISADVILPQNLTPIVFEGEASLLQDNNDGTKTWYLRDDTGLMLYLFAADYVEADIETKYMKAQLFYSRKHEAVMERFHIRQVLADVIDYCTEHIGPLTFAEDSFKIVQMSAYMSGGYAGNGMSVMSEDSFAENGLDDIWEGASGSETMAHEIIHQWWGLDTQFMSEDYSSEWSAEGLTVYTTYRLMKEKYGEEYARKNYVDVWQSDFDAYRRNFYHRHPEYLDILPEQYAASIRLGQRHVNQYRIMPLKILKAEKLVGGEGEFDRRMAELFRYETTEDWSGLTYDDFLNACGLTMEDLELE